MKTPAEMIHAEIGAVAVIVRAACAVETARRGTPVSPHDLQVQNLAADLILNGIGADLRQAIYASEMSPD